MKKIAILSARKIHQNLAWLALAALLLFLLSALSHPLMVWTGPQPQQFMPPSMILKGEELPRIQQLLAGNDLHARIYKAVPSPHGPMLQITHDEKSPRQYLPLNPQHGLSPPQLQDYDRSQAIWLARYYSGEQGPIKAVHFINEFNHHYPWVNRLLPVYQVEFERSDNLTVYVHTETNALAAINNQWKTNLQSLFQMLHTWSWLDGYPLLRVLIISLLLASLLSMAAAGLVMMLFIKRKKFNSLAQQYHRAIAGWLMLPFLALCLSALYHLWQAEYGEQNSGMRLSQAINIKQLDPKQSLSTAAVTGKALNGLSIIEHQGTIFYRASLARNHDSDNHQPHQHSSKRQQNFDGNNKEQGAILIAANNSEHAISEAQIVNQKALQYLGLAANTETKLQLVKHFGNGYDFRNKRLPVWRVDINNAQADSVFIDPATGILVEHLQHSQKLERLSFSLLHKWNFLVPWVGREGRDAIIVIFLLTFAGFAYMGLRLKLPAAKAG
ncbi:PepSY domain-containing protein [Dasania sp. GY-MA-18]|uniref:PepSY domain-containing protein n=1 Tax=Dasania phycosphaerae TaxID=2950436 RepID=A0A9J6RHW4_9GAMM|nr:MULTISPECIES: PepSY domain-containing protein [Dasania]MCR8921428.1 PepSY domain-containing protein [Dasania sp. GY-MA-18]MCZ0863856.1 PepSY domain-containing protein [Dasania phycosphaerae]MCZ0867584.1 PepSY domain-containing protein [Dasania phycosphaerae]